MSTKHGGYGVLRLGPRTAEWVEYIRPLLPVSDPADEIAIALLGFQLSRLEAAAEAMARLEGEGDREAVGRLEQDARGWAGSTKRLLSELLLTPAGRARAARDLGIGRDAASRATARSLEEHLARRRSGSEDGRGDGAGGPT